MLDESATRERLSTATLRSPVGGLRVRVGPAGLRDVAWVDPQLVEDAQGPDRGDDAAVAAARIAEYFAGTRQDFGVMVDFGGLTGVQEAVLRALFETVGFGQTVTYGELSRRSGTGVPARGIGAIMAANRVPIVVPCHRVVASDGLGGYSGGLRRRDGLEVKRWLLTHEGALPPTLLDLSPTSEP